MKGTRGGTQAAGYLLPAPIYLQQQRARMMMMMELQKATAHVDVYLVGSNNTGVGGAARVPAGAAPATPRPPQPERQQSPSQRHFGYANLGRLSGDQPAEWFCRYRQSDQRGDLRAAVSRARDHRAREGVSGRCRLPPEEADEAGSDDDHAGSSKDRFYSSRVRRFYGQFTYPGTFVAWTWNRSSQASAYKRNPRRPAHRHSRRWPRHGTPPLASTKAPSTPPSIVEIRLDQHRALASLAGVVHGRLGLDGDPLFIGRLGREGLACVPSFEA